MNKSISFDKGLQRGFLIKDNITTDEKNKISMRNKLMNDSDGKLKNRNFLKKQVIKESKNNKNSKIKEECLPENCFQNNIFQYYNSTIEFLKKYYFNSYMNSKISKYEKNNISKNNNSLNKNNYFFCDKNLYNVAFINILNANINNNMKNYNFINNYKNKESNFIYNNKKENDKNKASGSNKNLTIEEEGKLGAFPKKEINNNNINSFIESNNNELKIFIININCPSFKPSNFNNKEIKNITSESNTISNKVENKIRDKENGLAEDEYSIKMFGKKGWICVLCNNFNFETRILCNRCKSLKNPKKIVYTKSKIKKGLNSNKNKNEENNDWICSKCQNLNYSFRTICNRCKAPKIYQFLVKPIFYQNIIFNNIIRDSPKLMPFYIIINNTPNNYLNKIA